MLVDPKLPDSIVEMIATMLGNVSL